MSITGPGSITAANVLAQTNMMNQLSTDSQELGTGQAAQNYAGLGSQAGITVQLNSQLAAINGFASTITTADTTMSVAQSALSQIGSAGSAVQNAISTQSAYSLDNSGQTTLQQQAASYLDQILAGLNTQVGTNYIFSGSAVTQPSVAPTSEIINGNGPQQGLTQVIANRLQADQGADGLGRLVIPAVTGSTVTVSQQNSGSPFGFQLTGVNSALTGATTTGPTGTPPSISVDLGSQPNSGDSIQFTLGLPDGSSQTVTLTATSSSTPGTNQFSIGATAADTATNLQAALTTAVTNLGQTALPAASAIAAATNYFSDPPQIVSGTPASSATSLTNGTSANTVIWYTGENGSTTALQTQTAQIGPDTTIAFGMRATEQAFTTMLANVGALAATTYSSSNSNAEASYQALCASVQSNLAGKPGVQTVNDVAATIANAQTTAKNTSTVNTQTQATLQNMVQGIDGVNQAKIGEDILTLQNSLDASMSVTARLAGISLVNFLAPVTG
jgi:flagellin-like hook-associated protein FlgL